MNWFPVTGKTFLVLGLARSGLATIQWLLHKGAIVFVWDDSPDKCQKAIESGAHLLGIASLKEGAFDAVVQSPGVPLYFPKPHPVTAVALAEGIPIISDIDLFRRENPENIFVGITGTNGKSTTTALICHILQRAGKTVFMGGNIGVPVLSKTCLSPQEVAVLELSSYQLDLSHSLNLDIAVWLNITPDHLDRHGTLENYVQAKRRLFEEAEGKTHIIGLDDPESRQTYDLQSQKKGNTVIPFSSKSIISQGVYVNEGKLVDEAFLSLTEGTEKASEKSVLSFDTIPHLKGVHNFQNICAAYATCRSLGISADVIIQAIQEFPGLSHRQEYVRSIGSVSFINDSKATNADAASRALATFDRIFWILGGKAKTDGIEGLDVYFPKIKKAFLIGDSQDKFADQLEGLLPYDKCYTLEQAIQRAFEDACQTHEPSIVLLSPACASFDQFRDFEHRGDVFKEIVLSLKEDSC